ncbi:hypothetical protein GCM10025772_23680 [Ferrimonas gelatinilytica]|uniref:Amidohydrolase n=1 Tax=Ferrimonas gelatinilytica TaxID=1255257 RepID=A0ABP9SBK8_9GAMM
MVIDAHMHILMAGTFGLDAAVACDPPARFIELRHSLDIQVYQGTRLIMFISQYRLSSRLPAFAEHPDKYPRYGSFRDVKHFGDTPLRPTSRRQNLD